MRFREKLMNFMVGRNGYDQLCIATLGLAMALLIVNLFVHSVIIVIIEYLLLAWTIFRALSKNTYRRSIENGKFTAFWERLKRFFKLQKNKIRDRKTHVYRKCPHCKTVLRLPKIKGSHGVTCPRCSSRFDVKV
ncbi:MAG: zinc-ribbon domain-containing protein [Clostridia bacterium]|nr:zinc-ribbon domain-containing protein [Clostridia bacterium]